jgi:hypothetical protein
MRADILWDAGPIQLDLKSLLNFEATTRRRLPAFFVILTLMFAVSTWGLQYKLSLYHCLGVRHSVPEAKLLSQKERPVTSGHIERLRLSSRPFPSATHTFLPNSIAALPANAALVALRAREKGDLLRENAYALRLRPVSTVSPRPPPATA